MADAGIAARRTCEEWILQGRVRVNGELVTRLPAFVDPATDRIEVDGRLLGPPERHIYVMLNKPEGVVVTASDEHGVERTTVMDLVKHPSGARLYPAGRLEWDTRGLVLLTNDGELANRLTHPRFGVEKVYEVQARGGIDAGACPAIEQKARAIARHEDSEAGRPGRPFRVSVKLVSSDQQKALLEVTMLEARSSVLAEAMKELGMPIKKITRVRLGPLVLRALAPGAWRELTREELQGLRRGTSATRTAARPGARKPKNKNGARPYRPVAKSRGEGGRGGRNRGRRSGR